MATHAKAPKLVTLVSVTCDVRITPEKPIAAPTPMGNATILKETVRTAETVGRNVAPNSYVAMACANARWDTTWIQEATPAKPVRLGHTKTKRDKHLANLVRWVATTPTQVAHWSALVSNARQEPMDPPQDWLLASLVNREPTKTAKSGLSAKAALQGRTTPAPEAQAATPVSLAPKDTTKT